MIDYDKLIIQLQKMQRHHKLYKILKIELTKQGHWKELPRGQPNYNIHQKVIVNNAKTNFEPDTSIHSESNIAFSVVKANNKGLHVGLPHWECLVCGSNMKLEGAVLRCPDCGAQCLEKDYKKK